MKRFFFLCIVTFVTFNFNSIHAQDTYWIEAIGGEDRRNLDYAPSVIVTDDGYVAVGYSEGAIEATSQLDFLIVKLDKNGGLLWSRAIGGAQDDRAYTIEQTPDNGYFITGYTELNHYHPETSDIVAIKLSSDLTVEWAKVIGTIPGSAEHAFSGRRTEDGGYIIAGKTDLNNSTSGMDVLIVKLNSSGELGWAKTIGSAGLEHASGIVRTQDGGYAISGMTNSGGAGRSDVLILKLDMNNNLQWAKAVGSTNNESCNWDGIRQTSDGGFFIGGTITPPGGSDDFYFVKLQSNGNLDWAKVIIGENRDACWTVTPTTDGGYIAGGLYEGIPTIDGGNVLLVRLDRDANFLWATRLADTTFQEIEEIKEIEDGYVIAGVTHGDFLVAKLNMAGLVPGSSYTTRITPSIISPSIGVTPLSLVTTDVTPKVTVKDFTPQVVIPKLRIETLASVTGVGGSKAIDIVQGKFALYQSYPNPFNPTTTIQFSIPHREHLTLKVFDMLGREVATLVNGELDSGEHSVVFGAKDLPSGVYFYRLQAGSFVEQRKMVIIK